LAIVLALLAALVYGSADFFGGIASRRTPAATVVVVSQVIGLIVLALAWPFVRTEATTGDVAWGIAAGFFGAIAIAALYAALAVGRMGVVSPITAVTGAAIPVVVGLTHGDRPGGLALAGVAIALVAVALISGVAEARLGFLGERATLLALTSGLAIGFLYICLGRGGVHAALALLAAARATSLVILCLYLLVRREPLWPGRLALPTIALAGGLDMSANVLYVFATHGAMLAIVAVVTSLYPAGTVVLAQVFLKERLSGWQWLGLALGAGSVALIGI
jgi:drug/metabolite transporter (DMT)-like permease